MWQRAIREVFRREKVPVRFLWWLTADGLSQWYSVLRSGLADMLGGKEAAERELAQMAAPMFVQHYDELRKRYPELPDRNVEPDAAGLLMIGLSRVLTNPRAKYMFSALTHAPRKLRSLRLARMLPVRERWEELTRHLGELLIAFSAGLRKKGYPQANAVLGRLCFEMGVEYARKLKKLLHLPSSPQSAIEVLRKGEYLFRVNPEHWSGADAEKHTGFLEGTACPWYTVSGWSMMHCGIFGQFQSGICSVFDLRYQLSQTIPKDGGHTCRVDLRPLSK